jgi:hypothetical protein
MFARGEHGDNEQESLSHSDRARPPAHGHQPEPTSLSPPAQHDLSGA